MIRISEGWVMRIEGFVECLVDFTRWSLEAHLLDHLLHGDTEVSLSGNLVHFL